MNREDSDEKGGTPGSRRSDIPALCRMKRKTFDSFGFFFISLKVFTMGALFSAYKVSHSGDGDGCGGGC